MAGAGITSLVVPTGALEIGVVLSGAAILAALALVAMQSLVNRRLTRVPKPWKKTGVLGEVKRVPSSLSAELAFPLLQAENAISEDAEFNTNDTNYPGTRDSTPVMPSNGQAVRFGLSMQAFKRIARATQWSVGFKMFLDVHATDVSSLLWRRWHASCAGFMSWYRRGVGMSARHPDWCTQWLAAVVCWTSQRI